LAQAKYSRELLLSLGELKKGGFFRRNSELGVSITKQEGQQVFADG
jgi:hypothetical protein